MINCLNNSGFYHLQMKITVHVFLCIVVLNSVITEYVNTAIVKNKSTVHKKPLEKRKLNIIISYDESIKKRREFQEIKEAVESSSKYWKEALVVKIYQMGNFNVRRKCLSTQIRLSYLTNLFYCVNDYCSEEVKCNGMKIPDNYLSRCYNKKNGEYTLAFKEGSGLAENDLLLLVGNHDEQSTNPDDIVTPKICGIHEVTKRCLVGTLHYNLFGNKLAGISSHQLLILTKRAMGYLLNDLMTPYLLESHVMSRITLAYFEDTNLYDVNYKKAENFTWGKDLGCNFLMESCHEYIPKRKAEPIKINIINHQYADLTEHFNQYKCSKEIGLQISISGQAFTCPVNGGHVHVKLQIRNSNISANITCPPCRTMCGAKCPNEE
ncbi:Leishmanolysin-like peptidase [Schistosoma japonicum]|nr:Leishmanolysin-like peptidase [Schistosoma japonicum]